MSSMKIFAVVSVTWLATVANAGLFENLTGPAVTCHLERDSERNRVAKEIDKRVSDKKYLDAWILFNDRFWPAQNGAKPNEQNCYYSKRVSELKKLAEVELAPIRAEGEKFVAQKDAVALGSFLDSFKDRTAVNGKWEASLKELYSDFDKKREAILNAKLASDRKAAEAAQALADEKAEADVVASGGHINKWKRVNCKWSRVQKKDVLADPTPDALFEIVHSFSGSCPLGSATVSNGGDFMCYQGIGEVQVDEFATEGQKIDAASLPLDYLERARQQGRCKPIGNADADNALSLYNAILDSYIAQAKVAEAKRADSSRKAAVAKASDDATKRAKDNSKECKAAKARYHFCGASAFAGSMKLAIAYEKQIGEVSGAVNLARLRSSGAAQINSESQAKGYARQYKEATGQDISVSACGLKEIEEKRQVDVTADVGSAVKQFCGTGI